MDGIAKTGESAPEGESYEGYHLSPFDPRKRLINLSPGPAPLPQPVVDALYQKKGVRTHQDVILATSDDREEQRVTDTCDLDTTSPHVSSAHSSNDSGAIPHGHLPFEISHRSPEFLSLKRETTERLRKFLEIPDTFEVLFVNGGGHGQFAAVPMNLIHDPSTDAIDYLVTGAWSNRAFTEAEKYAGEKLNNLQKISINVRNNSESCFCTTISDAGFTLYSNEGSAKIHQGTEIPRPRSDGSVSTTASSYGSPEDDVISVGSSAQAEEEDITAAKTAGSSVSSLERQAYTVCGGTHGYAYLCSNETVDGLEFRDFDESDISVPIPTHSSRPLVVDMCADLGTKRVDWSKIAVAFACFSKNLGLAGGTVCILDPTKLPDGILTQTQQDARHYGRFLPSILDWSKSIASESLLQTPNTSAIFALNELLKFYLDTKAVTEFNKIDGGSMALHPDGNEIGGGPMTLHPDEIVKLPPIDCMSYFMHQKAQLVYAFLDNPAFSWIRPQVPADTVLSRKLRSRVNIPFIIVEDVKADEEGEVGNGNDGAGSAPQMPLISRRQRFLEHCYRRNIVGLATATPFATNTLRVSLYCGVSVSDVQCLLAVWKQFVP